MKDFAGSSITYYGLARKKLLDKYPRLVSVFMILALICMTGLAIFLISDLVSFASNSDHRGAPAGLDINDPENGITSVTNGRGMSGNNSSNSSAERLSNQTKKQSFANLSKVNTSLPSSQAARGDVAASKSSSDESSVIRHHSSSSSSSSAKSAKKSSNKDNLTNETAMLTNQSINNSQEKESEFLNAAGSVVLPQIDAANSSSASNSNLSNEVQIIVPSYQEITFSQGSIESEVALASIPSLSPSVGAGGISIPGKGTPAREPVSIIEFKTKATLSPKSEQGMNTYDKINTNPNSPAKGKRSVLSQRSRVAASIQAKKAKEVRDMLKANRNKIKASMKDRAAQSRARAAPN